MIWFRYAKLISSGLLLVGLAGLPAARASADVSPLNMNTHMQRLEANFISADGRVIDLGSERTITTSEGQSYGMFFALVSNRPALFQKLLTWTNNNLTNDGLSEELPAWLWGETDNGEWQVLDSNPASDADIWMAYSLLMAAKVWDQPNYAAIGLAMAENILDQSTHQHNDQLVLLPAPFGFVDHEHIRVNHSYFSLSVFKGLYALTDDPRWQAIYQSSIRIMANTDSAFAPDWHQLDTRHQPVATKQFAEGSYDAIRTYLWLALEAPHNDEVRALLHQYAGMANVVHEQGYPPAAVDTQTASYEGRGPIGFSAVLLTYLRQLDTSLYWQQQQRIAMTDPESYARRYFDTMLLLFGLGAEQCYGFDQRGLLLLNWQAAGCS